MKPFHSICIMGLLAITFSVGNAYSCDTCSSTCNPDPSFIQRDQRDPSIKWSIRNQEIDGKRIKSQKGEDIEAIMRSKDFAKQVSQFLEELENNQTGKSAPAPKPR